jgi:hypothetical protein
MDRYKEDYDKYIKAINDKNNTPDEIHLKIMMGIFLGTDNIYINNHVCRLIRDYDFDISRNDDQILRELNFGGYGVGRLTGELTINTFNALRKKDKEYFDTFMKNINRYKSDIY